MEYYVDYHVHTDNSFDSKTKMITYCQKAVELGLKEIVFTEHFDLNPFDAGLGLFKYQKYSQEIDECRQIFGKKLKIKKGLELGEPHIYKEQHEKYMEDKEFDFLLGSVHYLGDKTLPGDCDNTEEKKLYLEYFQEVWETAKYGNFHVLGHLDVLKRYVPVHFTRFKAIDYEEIIREILKAAIHNNKGIEINTSGFRQGLGEPLPAVEILQWYRELGGEIVTIGSDAHRKEDLGRDLTQGTKLVQELGFPGIATFSQGELTIKPFS